MSDLMNAAVYYGPGDIRLETQPAPSLGSGELLIAVETVGICGTDVGEYVHDPMFFPVERRHPISGHLGPTIPGHEFSGRVVAMADDVTGFAEGDLITSGSGVSCGKCAPCLGGRTNMCLFSWTVGLHRNGALAELVAVPAAACLNVEHMTMSADVAALVQPLSIATHATRRGRLSGSDTAVIIGTGGIGTFIAYSALAQGAEVVVVDLDQRRLDTAMELGAGRMILSQRGADLGAQIKEEAPDATLVFECTATNAGLDGALRGVGDNGRVVVVGHQPRPVELDFRLVSFGEKEFIGTMAHVFAEDLPTAVEILERGGDELLSIAPTVYPLDQLLESGILPMSEGRQVQVKTLFSPRALSARPVELHR